MKGSFTMAPRGIFIEATWLPRQSTPRTADPETYRAFLPSPISTSCPTLSGPAITALVEGERALTTWSHTPRTEVVTDLLRRIEAVASSRFEQETASADAITLALWQPHRVEDHSLHYILGNIAALEQAQRIGADERREPSLVDLLAVHRTLMGAVRPQIAGQLRTGPVWIGGHSPLDAIFNPPPAGYVGSLLEDLVEFIRRDDLPPLWQAMIAHAQFETIHPHGDGNGRTGRAIIALVLARHGMAMPLFSSRINERRGAYIEDLTAYRDGDESAFIIGSAEAMIDAVHLTAAAEQRYAETLGAALEAAGPVRAGSAVATALPALVASPITDVRNLADVAGVSETAAANAIASLAERGLLTPATGNLRNRRWHLRSGEQLLRRLGA